MADWTRIEWTDATWNPIRARNISTGGVGHYCTHASEGCRNCYSERDQKRFRNPVRFAAQDQGKVEIFLDEAVLTQPLRWRRPRKIFPCSMTDLFGEFVPDWMIDRVFAVMARQAERAGHTFQVLTKRAGRMRAWCVDPKTPGRISDHLDPEWRDGRRGEPIVDWPLPNVWLGVSAERQQEADQRIPDLLATPAALRFVSYEPALGPIDFTRIPSPVVTPEDEGYYHSALARGDIHYCDGDPDILTGRVITDAVDGPMMERLDWIIAGGESGAKARPAHPDWFRQARDQCAEAGVPFFFKQWGEWAEADHWLDHIERGPAQIEVSGRPWKPTRPLNYEDASLLAELAGFEVAYWSDGSSFLRVGKRRARRLLDGVTHDAFPGPR